MWNMENKSLTKTSLELDFEKEYKITSGIVTPCGNFAVIAFSDG